MRTTSRWSIAGILFVLSVWLGAGASRLTAEVWSHDFERAEAEAKRRGVPLLIHFHARYCGPCHQMEREVLSDPTVLQQLASRLVAVTIDTDDRPDLAQRFQISTIPCDVIRDPNGRPLDRSTGYRDRQAYLSMVARNAALLNPSRPTHIASQPKPPLRTAPWVTMTSPPLRPTAPPIAPSPLRSRDKRSGPLAVVISPTAPLPAPPPMSAARTPNRPFLKRMPLAVGLRGFSPVALSANRAWVHGDQRLAWTYKGVIYYMASSDELRRFKETPDRFAPQILGCDPVIFDVTDRAVPGDIRFAAFFDGELFLFVSEKSRQTFKQDPDRFVRTKHVLNADEFDDQRLE